MSNSKLSSSLNTLLTRNYDAEKGYHEVAEKVKDPHLKTFFKNGESERNRFGHEIKDIEKAYGIEPDKGSSLLADAHRAWIELRDKMSGDDQVAIIKEAIRGEKYAIEDYEKALDNEELSPDHKRILSDHLKAIKSSKDQLDKMEAAL